MKARILAVLLLLIPCLAFGQAAGNPFQPAGKTQTMTANLAMSGFKLTGLSAGSTAGDSVRYEQAFLLNATNAGDLLFTDATYDIGKSGATRPRAAAAARPRATGT
jgi:hypothetical protein